MKVTIDFPDFWTQEQIDLWVEKYVWPTGKPTWPTGVKVVKEINDETIFDKIRQWAKDRGIYTSGDPKTQVIKLYEEAGELSRAILKKDQVEILDGIGDCVVVLTNLAHLTGFTIEECIQAAYDIIKKRQGNMENGTFVKK